MSSEEYKILGEERKKSISSKYFRDTFGIDKVKEG